MSDFRLKLARDLQSSVNRFASDIGETRPTFGYLGKGDGSTTIVNASRTATREVWCYTSDSGRKSMPFSAVLDEGSGIPYVNTALNTDLPVVLAAPPGTDRLHVMRPNGSLAYTTPLGKSPVEQLMIIARGSVALLGGTATVNTALVTATNLILLTPQETGNITGVLRVSARVAGTSFTILSSAGTDTAVIAWAIVHA